MNMGQILHEMVFICQQLRTCWRYRSLKLSNTYGFQAVKAMSKYCVRFKTNIFGGGVQLGPLGTSAINWPIVPAPVIMRMENMVEWWLAGETEVLGENLPQVRFVDHKCHMTWPGANQDRRGGKSATNRLSYGTALFCVLLWSDSIPHLQSLLLITWL
jgi:hypothetical protein